MSDNGHRRRRVLQAVGAVGTAGLAGCLDVFGGGGDNQTFQPGQIGSGRGGDYVPAGTPMEAMPDLSGTIDVYSGRGQALVGRLFDYLHEQYPDLTINPRYEDSITLVNKIREEGSNSPADVFYSVNAGSLGALAEAGRTATLPDDVLGLAKEEFRDPEGEWTGTSGRARTIPYNTDTFGEGDIPDDIFAFPEASRFDDAMGWAPSYGSFQAFVTAMRVLNGREKTKQWLQGMLDSGVQEYADEFAIAQAVADGEIQAGFANHYYIQRVLDARPDAPLATAFTTNDAGAVFNVAGAAVVDTANDTDMAANFVRHLLSAEAQEYFITQTYEYPVIPEAQPIGDLPPVEELSPPPELDLSQLADYGPTIELLREVGITV
ncbi:extracellular solute-binding protein [Halomarina litorea]|uniref:extracellular solute-binding protein n=1 Tax=Halomarina litorea TaxID=2961595 RepID=UPI0020C3EFBF|nr:extracellular solute-binding protein [Halomarina sp. BCD28]